MVMQCRREVEGALPWRGRTRSHIGTFIVPTCTICLYVASIFCVLIAFLHWMDIFSKALWLLISKEALIGTIFPFRPWLLLPKRMKGLQLDPCHVFFIHSSVFSSISVIPFRYVAVTCITQLVHVRCPLPRRTKSFSRVRLLCLIWIIEPFC